MTQRDHQVVEPVFHVEFGPTFESDRYRIGAVVRGREACSGECRGMSELLTGVSRQRLA